MTFTKPTPFLCLFLLGAMFSTLANACPKSNCVRIGAWNVEWLGSENREQPSDEKTIAAIADLIANKLSIDIISLEEINTALDGEVRGEHYSLQPWQELQSALKKNGYETQSGDSGNGQRVVLAWRAPVTLLQKASDLPIPDHYDINEYCRSSHLRKPLAGWFRAGQFDFWLVGLHLKANGPEAKCTSAVRTAQVKALLPTLKPLLAKDTDVILIGDFNASSHHSSLNALIEQHFTALDDRERRSPASGTHSYHGINMQKDSSGSMLDHIIVSATALRAWQVKSTTIYKPEDSHIFSNTFSDHVPIWADFYTQKQGN